MSNNRLLGRAGNFWSCNVSSKQFSYQSRISFKVIDGLLGPALLSIPQRHPKFATKCSASLEANFERQSWKDWEAKSLPLTVKPVSHTSECLKPRTPNQEHIRRTTKQSTLTTKQGTSARHAYSMHPFIIRAKVKTPKKGLHRDHIRCLLQGY